LFYQDTMIREKIVALLMAVFVACSCEADVPQEKNIPSDIPIVLAKPFPQNETYQGLTNPTHLSQDELNKNVIDYYNYWKAKYVRKSNGVTPGGGYYVYMKGTGGDGNEITTSEAHGYGMLIFALMAGYEKDAKAYFDGMYNMFDQHRSTVNPNCMSWIIDKTEECKYDDGSATDGDMDIAYALLLADKQWSSEGCINYRQLSKEMITEGLKKSCMSLSSQRAMLGDWDKDQWSTRSSDWMVGHFRAYYAATGDTFWLDAAEKVYELINSITSTYSSTTGLMPDFIVGETPKPAPEYFLNEFKETDEYNWNACRYPWRIAADYAHYNTPEAKQVLVQLLDFIMIETEGEPGNINAGYYLNGEPMVDYTDGAFVGPLVLASTVDEKYQSFLNKGWDQMKTMQANYFGDTICLLNMIMISGNWWNPSVE